VQSFRRVQRVELGFDPKSILTVRLWLPQPNDPKSGPYFTHDARVTFYRRALERVAGLPGVKVAGGVNTLPLDGRRGRLSFRIDGRSSELGDAPSAEAALATPGYFRALGIDLVRGRLFDEHDDAKSPSVAVVTEGFANTFFPGEDAIGKRIGPTVRGPGPTGPLQAAATNWVTIVGVVRNVRTRSLESEPAAVIYRSVWQTSNLNLTLVVRTDGAPAVLAEGIRREVHAVDPTEPVYGVRTMDDVVAAALAQRRFTMLLLALFAATALLLSAIGIYGVTAYFVNQRTQEIGIRVALGAAPRDVIRLVLGQGVRLAACGVAAGLIGALGITRSIDRLLYGISARDPLTFVTLAAVLTAIALLACYVPARRATRVDPIVALRYE